MGGSRPQCSLQDARRAALARSIFSSPRLHARSNSRCSPGTRAASQRLMVLSSSATCSSAHPRSGSTTPDDCAEFAASAHRDALHFYPSRAPDIRVREWLALAPKCDTSEGTALSKRCDPESASWDAVLSDGWSLTRHPQSPIQRYGSSNRATAGQDGVTTLTDSRLGREQNRRATHEFYPS